MKNFCFLVLAFAIMLTSCEKENSNSKEKFDSNISTNIRSQENSCCDAYSISVTPIPFGVDCCTYEIVLINQSNKCQVELWGSDGERIIAVPPNGTKIYRHHFCEPMSSDVLAVKTGLGEVCELIPLAANCFEQKECCDFYSVDISNVYINKDGCCATDVTLTNFSTNCTYNVYGKLNTIVYTVPPSTVYTHTHEYCPDATHINTEFDIGMHTGIICETYELFENGCE